MGEECVALIAGGRAGHAVITVAVGPSLHVKGSGARHCTVSLMPPPPRLSRLRLLRLLGLRYIPSHLPASPLRLRATPSRLPPPCLALQPSLIPRTPLGPPLPPTSRGEPPHESAPPRHRHLARCHPASQDASAQCASPPPRRYPLPPRAQQQRHHAPQPTQRRVHLGLRLLLVPGNTCAWSAHATRSWQVHGQHMASMRASGCSLYRVLPGRRAYYVLSIPVPSAAGVVLRVVRVPPRGEAEEVDGILALAQGRPEEQPSLLVLRSEEHGVTHALSPTVHAQQGPRRAARHGAPRPAPRHAHAHRRRRCSRGG
eukprot:scaffold55494_cov75-Phaeocystis_antarctica.AAC.3